MKLLIFSDIHASKDSAISTPSQSGYTRYQDILLESFGLVAKVAREVCPDILVFGGDCFHSPQFVDTRSLNVVGKGFALLQNAAKLKLALVGNHDIYSMASGLHSLEFLRSAGWQVVDHTSVYALGAYEIGAVPYQDHDDVELPDTSLIVSHIDIVGSVRRVLKSASDTSALADSGVDPAQLSRYKLVLNGHYHNPSVLAPNIHNVGSLLCRDFSDKGSPPRGVTIFDSVSGVSFIENPYAEYFGEFSLNAENDLLEILSNDRGLATTHGKIFYREGLKEYAETLAESLAGSWLYPMFDDVEPSDTPQPLNATFSLEENLRTYIRNNYGDEELEQIALDILAIAGQSTEVTARAQVEIHRVEIRGFQSIDYVLVDLYRQGLVLLRGDNRDESDSTQSDNGAGKSTFIEAIYWCITGKSLRGCRGDDVIGWAQSGCYVALELEVGGTLYTQVRSRNDSVHSTGSKLHVGSIEDIENDSSIAARIKSSADEQVLALIGRDEKSLKQVSFMTSDSPKFSSLGYEKRARLLEDILGAYPYKLAQDFVDRKCGDLQIELASERSEVSTYKSMVSSLSARLEGIRQEVQKLADSVDSQDITLRVKDLEANRVHLEDSIKAIDQEQANLYEVLPQLRKKISVFYLEAQNLRSQESAIVGETDSILREMRRLETCLARSLCPECGEPTNAPRLNLQLFEQKQLLEPRCIELAEVQALLRTRASRLAELRAHLDSKERLTHQNAAKIQSLRSELVALEAPLVEARSRQAVVAEKSARLDASYSAVKSELDSASENFERANAQLQISEKTLRQYFKLRDDVFDESGVRNELLSQVAIPFLNRILQNSARQIVGRNLYLSSMRELKSGSVRNEIDIVEEGKRTYVSNSDGERSRVDMCIQLALGDLGTATGRSRFGFLAIDEAMASLDGTGLQAVCEYLEGNKSTTVLLTTHSLPPVGPTVWTAVKEKGITSLVA